MRSIYDDIVKDALYPRKRGVLSKRNKHLGVAYAKEFSAAEIKALRLRLRLSSSLFAALFAVNVHTVEAWEKGTNKPSGPARRLMTMLSASPDILVQTDTLIQFTAPDRQTRQ